MNAYVTDSIEVYSDELGQLLSVEVEVELYIGFDEEGNIDDVNVVKTDGPEWVGDLYDKSDSSKLYNIAKNHIEEQRISAAEDKVSSWTRSSRPAIVRSGRR